MAKKKSYSPEAIISRAQAQADTRKAEFEQVKQKQEQIPPEELTNRPIPERGSKPSVSQTGSGKTLDVPLYGTAGLYTYARPQNTVRENTPAPLPWMAVKQTSNGMPLYGTGPKSWLRKMWADVSDPDKYFQDQDKLTEAEADRIRGLYNENIEVVAQGYEDKFKWSVWGEKFFGLTAREIAALPSAIYAEAAIAESADLNEAGTAANRVWTIARDTTQNVLWGGLAILGMDDTTMRKIHTTAMGLDSVADRFNKDENNNLLSKLYSSNPIAVTRDLITVIGAVNRGELTWSDTGEQIKKYQLGYDMAYTMIFDEYKRAQFEKGLAEGKDPQLLAYDYLAPGTELFGSILGSPSTYLGTGILKPLNPFSKASMAGADMFTFAGREIKIFGAARQVPWKTVYRIPTFGEIIGAEIGKARLAKQAMRFNESEIVDDLRLALGNVNKATGEADALRIMNETAQKTAVKLDDMRRHKQWWNLFTLDNKGKISVTSKDASFFIQNMIAREGSMDGALQVMRDMLIARRGGDEAVEAVRGLLSRPNSSQYFSEVGNMVAEIVERLDGKGIVTLLKKSKNPVNVHAALYKNLESALNDFIPSVDDMQAARRALTAAKIPPETANLARQAAKAESVTDEMQAAVEAVEKAGLNMRHLDLSAKLDEVPKVVRAVTLATRPSEWLTKKTSRAMVQTFMNFVPRAFVRNITGTIWQMTSAVGLKTAIESLALAFTGLNKKKTMNVLEGYRADMIKRFGFVPPEAALGIGDQLAEASPGAFKIGMLPSMNRAEQIQAASIVLTGSTDHVRKTLPAVVSNLKEWDAVVNSLPKEQQPLLFAALNRAYGVYDDAVEIFRKWVGDGEIQAWRVTEPSPAMRKQLEHLGLMDSFYDVQMNAKTVDDFRAFVDKAVDLHTKTVTNAAAELPWLTDKVPEGLTGFGLDLAKHAPEARGRIIRGLIQSWQNTLDSLDNARETTLRRAKDMAVEIAATTGKQDVNIQLNEILASMRNTGSVTRKNHTDIDYVREVVNRLNDTLKPNMTSKELAEFWKQPVKLGDRELFNLSKIYPQADLSTMTAKDFKRLMWDAYFEHSASSYRNVNAGIYEDTMGKLEQVAKLFGTKIEDMVGGSKSGDNVFRVMAKFRSETANLEEAFSWQRFFRQLPADRDETALLRDVVGKFESVFPDWKGGQRHIVNAVRKITGKDIPYDQITLRQALTAVGKKYLVPPETNQLPTETEALYRGLETFVQDVRTWGDTVAGDWGKTVKSLPVDMEKGLADLKVALEPRLDRMKTDALAVGVSLRNFTLHDYNKTYFDHALTYLLGNSLHYWTTRTYAKALEMVLDNPRYANVYLNYKEYNARKNSDMPEWYRQNIQINSLMGIDLDNPLFFNLEASINPVYGLTGTDFNDPKKTVDWVSRMVNSMGQMGVGFSPLVNWAVAMHLYNTNEEEAGRRFAGRLLPQTSLIKSGSAALFGKPVELDPFTNFLSGGTDPYEKNRVAVQLAMMVRNREITSQEMIEISRNKEGLWWDKAVKRSAEGRFFSDSMSFFLGAGLRPRTQEDMIVEKFWKDYGAMIASRDMMTPDEYRQQWDNFRDNPEYGMFADALLLSRKSGDDMDTAYTYNVFGRIPPGQLSDATGAVGINPDLVNLFYESKGDFDAMGLSPSEQRRFMEDVADLGAWLKVPDNATRREWGDAKRDYKNLEADMLSSFGEDAMRRMQDYYDSDDKATYLEEHPDVRDMLDYRSERTVNNPNLLKYYGGIESLERFHTNEMYRDLEKKYGADIRKYESEYFDIYNVEKARFLNEHPELNEYWDAKNDLYRQNEKELERAFGAEIFDIADEYGDIFDKAGKRRFLREHPELREYWSMRDDLKKQVNERLLEEYGADIRRLETQYFDPKLDERGKFLEQHPELEPYWDEKGERKDNIFRLVTEFGNNLPEPEYATTDDTLVTPQKLQELTTPVPEMSFAEWQGIVGQPMTELIQEYWYNDEELPSEVESSLDYMADQYGYGDGQDMLRAIVQSMP